MKHGKENGNYHIIQSLGSRGLSLQVKDWKMEGFRGHLICRLRIERRWKPPHNSGFNV